MPIDRARCRQHLKDARFRPLFIEELGWDRHTGTLPIAIDGQNYVLTAIAQKRGMQTYTCAPPPDGRIPDYPVRRKIEAQVSKAAYEHLIVYVDAQKTTHTWQWARREAGKSTVCREHTYHQGQPGDSLLQKLEYIAFSLDEEEELTLTGVTARARAAFDVEKVTKRFYDRFKTEHAAFLQFLKDIPEEGLQRWYASVLINRLMFIYFIQKKGFLAGDVDYLPHKLAASMARAGNHFYRDFLCPLFFEGFAKKEEDRSTETRALLGNIPYLDGGLFQRHQIEQTHGQTINPPDEAFVKLFRFFDEYQWNLDQRINHPDNEINPDVLGYIFEKYINQKEMGAYYTKEDITGYICRNTILPFLFDKLSNYRYEAVTPLPVRDMEPYIYPAVAQQDCLPTETEREYKARQARLEEIRADFSAGKIASISDFITYNLDIELFAQDWVRELTDPQTLRAFYFKCLSKLTVLDPTVGSGAFLFAAMNILEPLYEACLDKMEQLQDPKYPDFRKELARVAEHPSRRYFVLKSVVVNNLYGVDIMEEATEICKLRLFLKLVAQLEPGHAIEPLPDIDFNIRAGNSLVGCATKGEVEGRFFSANLVPKINEVDAQLRAYRELQTQVNIPAETLRQAKTDTEKKLTEIETELNEALRADYGAPDLATFVANHRPFHWYVEFNAIMQDGGFEVIVGNPPYVEYSKVRAVYRVIGYATESCNNLYALTLERSLSLLHNGGKLGLIVPVSFASSGALQPARDCVSGSACLTWLSHFSNRPGQLFSGAQNRLTVLILSKTGADPAIFSTRYHRWDAKNGERDHLFPAIRYQPLDDLPRLFSGFYPKVGTLEASNVLHKTYADKTVSRYLAKGGGYPLYWVRVPGYFCQFFLDAPLARPEKGGQARPRGELNMIMFATQGTQRMAHAILNSSTYYQYFSATSDGRHINLSDVTDFPFDEELVSAETKTHLLHWSAELEGTMKSNTTQWRKSGLLIDSVHSKACKPVIDEIDKVLAEHYGFTDEELDFIINYDIKYRMGQELVEEEAE